MFYDAEWVKVSTRIGTDIRMKLMKKTVMRDQGLYHKKGDWGNLPAGEVCLCPVEGSTNGKFVVDASMAGIGLLKNPIKITVKDGYAMSIEGGGKAEELKGLLENLNDKRVYNIAELGIGTNPKAIVSGFIIEDEKAIGTAHIALGNNVSYGGSVAAPCHLDGVFRNPTIMADDKYIMKDGKFVV